jgi:hypothetical protein
VRSKDGRGIIDEAAAIIRHFLAQPPVKRVDIWWHWELGAITASRPELEVPIELDDFLGRNAAENLSADACYRITDPSKFVHN